MFFSRNNDVRMIGELATTLCLSLISLTNPRPKQDFGDLFLCFHEKSKVVVSFFCSPKYARNRLVCTTSQVG